VIYVLDNEPITDVNGLHYDAQSQILPFTWAPTERCRRNRRRCPGRPTLANPIYLLVESKGKFLYVANQGNNTQGANAQSGIAGYCPDHHSRLPAQLHRR
jgi:hypothetical protein